MYQSVYCVCQKKTQFAPKKERGRNLDHDEAQIFIELHVTYFTPGVKCLQLVTLKLWLEGKKDFDIFFILL